MAPGVRGGGPLRPVVLDGRVGGEVVSVGEPGSADLAEGDAAARRCGDAELLCWAEPLGASPSADVVAPGLVGWEAPCLPPRRYRAFAVEDAGRDLLAAAVDHHLGPDVLSPAMLSTLGAAAWTTIRQYRTELAALWGDLERCRGARSTPPEADT